ncbi:MAG: response regulator [Bdellovibrionota bacterium]
MIYRILIIEDDLAYKPLWADILRRYLGGHVAEICWAVSAEEARIEYEKSVATQKYFDFIITDVFLAGSDTGLDFVENIFADDQEAPPVILISSVDKEEVEGIVDTVSRRIEILTKPINALQFKEVMNRITENRRAI